MFWPKSNLLRPVIPLILLTRSTKNAAIAGKGRRGVAGRATWISLLGFYIVKVTFAIASARSTEKSGNSFDS